VSENAVIAGPVEGPPVDPEKVRILEDALAEMRRLHSDFDSLQDIMDAIAKAVTPDFSKISVAQYCEVLYCAAKHGAFCSGWREQILFEGMAPASSREM